MCKVFAHNKLRQSRARRPAFSLVELIVAVGILILLLAMAGQVFSLTTRSTGQATALTNVHHLFRTFEKTVRDDFASVKKDQSVLLIYANPINAYWTQPSREADDDNEPNNGYPHVDDPERESFYGNGILDSPRADILMLFSGRSEQSSVLPDGVQLPVQVVYGHANLGNYVPDPSNTTGFRFAPDLDAFPEYPGVSPTPARRWHLARRSVLLSPDPPVPGQDWAVHLTEDGENDDWISVLKGTTDVVGGFIFSDQVQTPGAYGGSTCRGRPLYLPKAFFDSSCHLLDPPIFARSLLDTAPPAPMARTLGHYFLPNCASFKVEWALDSRDRDFVNGCLKYEKEIHWIDQGDLGDPTNPGQECNPLLSLEKAIDEAIDEVALGDPPDRRDLLRELLNDPLGGDIDFPYSLAERFRDDPEWLLSPADNLPRIAVFTAARLDSQTGEIVTGDDLFPSALRITIDVFDEQNRFEKPLRHVIIVPVGG